MDDRRTASPMAAILGCAGTVLSPSERAFFRDCDPAGFILFARNIEAPDQVRALVSEMRACVGREDALVLIDQEGGRVARLKPPHWRAAPPQGIFGKLDPGVARRAAKLNARMLADELMALGINVDCLPLLDLRFLGAHDIIGERAFGETVETVSLLGRAVCEGLLEGGVLPVIKHIPGHGRARADSHLELPRVDAGRDELETTDFAPFRNLADMPLAMTAHTVYDNIDPNRPATTSPTVMDEIVRGFIGYDGLVMTDDLSMKALGGDFAARTADSLAAGCDLVLHCNGDMGEMKQVAGAARPLDAAGLRRYHGALDMFGAPEPFDREAALAELAALTGDASKLT
ncbi:MAG: beta-N-acetylhexosaminidase [Alphaproteobacteria bacterium]|nr:beta-N-acetylhexosaminidase [Alphaproteobacteria bacterium]